MEPSKPGAKVNSFATLRKIIAIILVILLLALGVFLTLQNNKTTKTETSTQEYKNYSDYVKNSANTDDGRRAYLTDLSFTNNDSEARKVAEENLTTTGNVQDAINLLQICVIKEVGDKNQCAKTAIPIINNNYGKLDFNDAYSTAEMLEKIGEKTLAAKLYELALTKYVAYKDNGEVKLMTKAELEQKIGSLTNE